MSYYSYYIALSLYGIIYLLYSGTISLRLQFTCTKLIINLHLYMSVYSIHTISEILCVSPILFIIRRRKQQRCWLIEAANESGKRVNDKQDEKRKPKTKRCGWGGGWCRGSAVRPVRLGGIDTCAVGARGNSGLPFLFTHCVCVWVHCLVWTKM